MVAGRVRQALIGAATAVVSVIATLIVLELGARAATGHLLEWKNYATAPIVNFTAMNSFVQYDAELGYTHIPNRPEHGTGPIGNRLHRGQTSLPERPILAIGDSFTYGSEVDAGEAWPAYLEGKLGVPVVNAGVGGYGIDQMVLLAERLVPAVKPRLLLLSFIPPDITRVQMSAFSNAEKPYFEIERGALILRNVPAPAYKPTRTHVGLVRPIVGYSYLLDFALERLGYANWWRVRPAWNRMTDADPVAVTCLLWRRLAKLTTSTPVVVIAQSGWYDFVPAHQQERALQKRTLQCARDAGLQVIDTFGPVERALWATGKPDFRSLYVGGTGHMTAAGNELIASIIAASIQKR